MKKSFAYFLCVFYAIFLYVECISFIDVIFDKNAKQLHAKVVYW